MVRELVYDQCSITAVGSIPSRLVTFIICVNSKNINFDKFIIAGDWLKVSWFPGPIKSKLKIKC